MSNVALLVAAAVVSAVAVASYHAIRPRKNGPLSLSIGVIDVRRTVASAAVAFVLYTLFYAVVSNILGHDRVAVLSPSDGTLVYLLCSAALCAAVGQGMHCASKNVSYHLNRMKQHDAYVANRVFHIPFSHHVMYASAIAFACLVMSLEVNHPDEPMGRTAAWGMVGVGMVLGGAFGVAIRAGFVTPKTSAWHVVCQACALGVAIAFCALIVTMKPVDLLRLPVTTCLASATCVAFGVVSFHAARRLTSGARR